MAQYRFSSQVVSRSTGRSAVAAAAYRAGTSLADERTGLTHDFSRKRGIAHAEIMAPENAPAWMLDRSRLWNAVEAAEKRRDAQLSREVQLSLPHELTEAQRIELVRGFVNSQFVARGMIADIAIHRPDHQSDDRNHHAHIMLTMRELTGEGFGNKAREWNDKELLQTWREEWAHEQNRTLERYNHPSRVDHRSFADRGIDREPQQHMGPRAHGIEQRGERSRIGDENRQRDERNADRAGQYREAHVINLEIERFRRQHEQQAMERAQALEAAQALSRLDLDRKLHAHTLKFQGQVAERFGQTERTLQAETHAAQERNQSTGWKRLLRKVTGAEGRDRLTIEQNTATLGSIAQRKAEMTAEHMRQQADQLRAFEQRQQEQRDQLKRDMAKEAAAREKQILSAQRQAAAAQKQEMERQARAQVQQDMARVRAAAERSQAEQAARTKPQTRSKKYDPTRRRSSAIERQGMEAQAARTDREKAALRLEVERQQAAAPEQAQTRTRQPRKPRQPRQERAARQAGIEQQARQNAAPQMEQKPMRKPFDDARRIEPPPPAPKHPHEPQRVNVAEPRLTPQGMPQPRPAQVQDTPKVDRAAEYMRQQQPTQAQPVPARRDFRQTQPTPHQQPAQPQPASRQAEQLPNANRDFRQPVPPRQQQPQPNLRDRWTQRAEQERAAQRPAPQQQQPTQQQSLRDRWDKKAEQERQAERERPIQDRIRDRDRERER